ncbi:MAG: DUF2232 domain-containing protein [Deltaproteobacteria bacterium]|nr:DUF2232 domain-containing protein [Deltaproteobacteria bacterium]
MLSPGLQILFAGLISGGVFLVPRALLLLAPAPLLLLHRREGPWRGLEATGLGALLVGGVALFGGAWTGSSSESLAAYLLMAGLPAALLSWGLDRRPDPRSALAWAFGGWFAVASLVLVFSVQDRDAPAAQVVRGAVERGLDGALAASAARAGDDLSALEGLDEVVRAKDRLVNWAVRLLPGLLGAAGLLGLWMNLVYVRWFTGWVRTKEDDLCRFTLPFPVIWAVLASMALLLIGVLPGSESLPPLWWLVTCAANVLVFLGALYWLQGVAVVNWWFLRLPLSPLLRALGLGMQVMAMAIPVFSTGYLVAGLSDTWLDLRGGSRDDDEKRVGAER